MADIIPELPEFKAAAEQYVPSTCPLRLFSSLKYCQVDGKDSQEFVDAQVPLQPGYQSRFHQLALA